ncbi:NAD-dependent epimerase/dehydratase family protein [Gemmatimonas sp.]|uniref:NAD-dependent epimerase/dehydratase family protein n=1 Tax=Gemmatimonas sp. TaxID=1962908 RepID=UPI003983559B
MTSGAPTNELALDALLSAPDERTRSALAALAGDVLILGAGGKMGPTVARMARRAIADVSRRVIAVSRFTDDAAALALNTHGVETIRADLADPAAVAALPDAPNVLWMAGQKFGSTGDPVGTWTQNVVASTIAAQRYAGSRMVCFSTGNVYGRQAVALGGARERDALVPDGEYAASCIGRERVFESIARRTHTPLLLYRLFYACDLRYGVVTDIAHKVLHGMPVSLDTAFVNVIWQGDANRLALRALYETAVPAADVSVALNVTGPVVAVRDIAERVGAIGGVRPVFAGAPRDDALIANTNRLTERLPYTALPLDTLCEWAVHWIRGDGRLLHKPTKFEVRDGRY